MYMAAYSAIFMYRRLPSRSSTIHNDKVNYYIHTHHI